MAGWDALWEVAADQHGYVTMEQAEKAGVTYDALKQAAWRGHIERPVRGIYRLPTVPATGHDLEAPLAAIEQALTSGVPTYLVR